MIGPNRNTLKSHIWNVFLSTVRHLFHATLLAANICIQILLSEFLSRMHWELLNVLAKISTNAEWTHIKTQLKNPLRLLNIFKSILEMSRHDTD